MSAAGATDPGASVALAAGLGATAQLHASAVAVEGRGCLITGRAGAGKSTLALEMLALGAELVADDRVDLRCEGAGVALSAPPALAGLLEARGAGILRLASRSQAPLALVVDLDEAEAERLPPRRDCLVLGERVPLIRARAMPGVAALAMVLLRSRGLCDPEAAL